MNGLTFTHGTADAPLHLVRGADDDLVTVMASMPMDDGSYRQVTMNVPRGFVGKVPMDVDSNPQAVLIAALRWAAEDLERLGDIDITQTLGGPPA